MRRPGFSRAFSVSIFFNSTKLSETKMPVLADLFFIPQVYDFGLVMNFF
jgi:hypothetical protein